MTTPKTTLWPIEPHTKAKHKILQRYLSAWFPILGKYNQRIVYIDGFSGPGRYAGGEPGSPLIALEAAIKHRQQLTSEIVFWFIDDREDRIERLESELAGISIPSHFKVYPQVGRFDNAFRKVLNTMDTGGTVLAPTFAFIDPFGFSGIPFALVEKLLMQPRCEVLITFMVDSINRFLETPQDAIVEHIVDAFGTSEAMTIAQGPGDRISKLRALYQSKLNSVARYVRYFEMHDRNDRIQYYLFFATQNCVGHVKMKEAMWSVDPDGEFRFSDSTNPDQLVLFEIGSITGLLNQLRAKFSGKGQVSGIQVRSFIENETAYLKRHMKEVLMPEELRGRIVVEPYKLDRKRRRLNTYPDDAIISFL